MAEASEKAIGDASVLMDKGNAYYNAGSFTEALDYYTDALKAAEESEDTSTYMRCLGNIGNVYASIHDYSRSLEYFLHGYDIAEKTGKQNIQFLFATNLVQIYCILNQSDNARLFYKKQMQLHVDDSDFKKFFLLYNEAKIAAAEGNDSMAEFYMEKSLAFAIENNLKISYVFDQYIEWAEFAMSKRDVSGARDYLNKAASIQNLESSQESKLYKTTADLYRLTEDDDSVQKYTMLYKQIADSLWDHSRFYIAHNKLFDYENTNNQKKIKRLVNKTNFLIAVVIAFIILFGAIAWFAVVLRRRNRNLKIAYEAIIAKNEEILHTEMLARQNGEMQTRNNMDSNNTLKEVAAKVDNILLENPVVFNHDFSLNYLAEMVDSNTKYVSQIINEKYGKNFRQVINSIRIKEATKRIADRETYGSMTLQYIYESIGFHSAASFIQAFKKENGMTPSTYLKIIAEKNGRTASDTSPDTE